MTKLFLIRHGPTHAKTMVGWSNLPADLSDKAALQRLSDFLPKDGIVVSSDLLRASATADAILGNRIRLADDDALREIHFGDWELQSFRDIEAHDPDRIRAYWDTPGDVHPPNGESWNDITARVDPAIDHLIASNSGKNIVVVAHFGVILTQVQRAKRMTNYETFSHRIDNLSVTSINISRTPWALEQINHIP